MSTHTLLLAILLAITCFYANLARDSYMDDFRAFYVASAATLHHLDPYSNNVGVDEKYADALWLREDSRFIYPPSALFFVAPLSKISYKWSKTGFGTVMALIMAGLLSSLHRRFPKQTLTLLVLFLTLPMFMNIDNGNMDILILALTMAAFYLDDGLAAGFCLGLAISIKFAPLLTILWFVSQKRWKTAGWSLGISGVLALAAFHIWGASYYQEFFIHLVQHAKEGMPQLEHTFQTVRIIQDRTIVTSDGLYAYQHDIGGYAQNPLRFLGKVGGVLGPTLLLGFTFWLYATRKGRSLNCQRSFFLFLVISLTANHLLWAMGLVACFPLTVLLVDESRAPRQSALLLLVPLILTKQFVGEGNFLLWLCAAAFCMVRNGWFSPVKGLTASQPVF